MINEDKNYQYLRLNEKGQPKENTTMSDNYIRTEMSEFTQKVQEKPLITDKYLK